MNNPKIIQAKKLNLECIEDLLHADLTDLYFEISQSIDDHFGPFVPDLQLKVGKQFDEFQEDFAAKITSIVEAAIEKSPAGELIYTEHED